MKNIASYSLTRTAVSFLLLFGAATRVDAFQISPVVAILEPQGIKAEQVYLLTNSSADPAAVEFTVTTRQQRRDGTEIRESAEHLFNLYPTQVVIPSGGTQKVRLKWLGKKKVTGEQAYRVIAEQLPINLSAEKGMSVKLVMKMETVVYVKPTHMMTELSPDMSKIKSDKATEKLQITAIKTIETPKGKQLKLTVENSTNEHIVLQDIQITLAKAGKNILLQGDQLGILQQQSNILSGAIRDFIMPIPEKFDQQQGWKASIQPKL